MSKKLTKKWLKDAHYKIDHKAILPYLDIYLPNSATSTQVRYRGKAQCDIVQCLLDALNVPGESYS